MIDRHRPATGRAVSVVVAICLLTGRVFSDDKQPVTGPATEQRFPPLVVPEGFHATLFACDPLVEYPSVIALGPEPGTLFVAYDYMTGLGEEIIRRDEVRIVRDRDHDGYADESTLYADGFNSIQGLAFSGGMVFVMHAPYLTSLADTDGDGVADQRRDLLSGLGLPPEENSNRLHCANGVVAGHDGWLYLALGDRGCDTQRAEGDRLVFQEGGILRCRPDGRDLHVFSRGLRNIYDVALDEELNVFLRDNENDGGDYMIRVCHCFHGSDHGYPYLYLEHPDEGMRPLADLGRGSSAGGTTYLEAAFPQEFRESLFFCEWGRAVVRYPRQRAGGGFSAPTEIDFAAGAADDPYGFKPTDLVVDRDGSLLISDWCDGQRPKRGRGRIYRITYGDAPATAARSDEVIEDASLEELWSRLDSPSSHVRIAAQELLERRGPSVLAPLLEQIRESRLGPLGRLHAVWIVAHVGGANAVDELFQIAADDVELRVRAQAVKAIADLTDPVIASHRLDAPPAAEDVCRRVAELWTEDPRIQLEVVTALGRLRWAGAPQWLCEHSLPGDDPALAHAAMQLLRRSGNWSAVLELLDDPRLRAIALRALAEEYDTAAVDGLLARLRIEPVAVRRREYCELLARVYQQPAPWTYWGFRPAPRPANSVPWERSEAIAAALDAALLDPEIANRAAVVRRMLREGVPVRLEQLQHWLAQDTSADGVAAILDALNARPVAEVRPSLEEILKSPAHNDENRLSALKMLARDAEGTARLREIADTLDEGPVLAAAIRELADQMGADYSAQLVRRLASSNDDVRAAAATALTHHPVAQAGEHVVSLLADADQRVRVAAALLAGQLHIAAQDRLLALATDTDRQLQGAALQSLLLLDDSRAEAAARDALGFPDSQLAAIRYLGRFGSPGDLMPVVAAAEQSRSMEVLSAVVAALLSWGDRPTSNEQDRTAIDDAIARIQGACGLPMVWRVRGPLPPDAADALATNISGTTEPIDWSAWQTMLISEPEASIRLAAESSTDGSVWLAVSQVVLPQSASVEVLATANAACMVRLDDRSPLIEQAAPEESKLAEHQCDAELAEGPHRLLVTLSGARLAEFRLRFRTKSSKAGHERLIKLALSGKGDLERGRALFFNVDKSQCMKCHRLGEQGGRIGPDLAGIGRRFSRIHIVESMLDPNRTIAPSYETMVVALVNGQVLTGVKSSETEAGLILGDNEGKLHEIAKSDIDDRRSLAQSTMPEGLEQKLTDAEFLDLVEFLDTLTD